MYCNDLQLLVHIMSLQSTNGCGIGLINILMVSFLTLFCFFIFNIYIFFSNEMTQNKPLLFVNVVFIRLNPKNR